MHVGVIIKQISGLDKRLTTDSGNRRLDQAGAPPDPALCARKGAYS
jgi:hypothetical protein